MALNFKNLPNVGDTIIVNSITYVWDSSNRWFTNFPGLVVSTGNAYKDANGVWWIASPDIGNQGDFVHGDLIFPSANIYFSLSNGVYGIYFDNGNASITFSNGSIQINPFSGGGGSNVNLTPVFTQANTARDTANIAFNNSNVAGNFANTAATAAYASVNNVSGTANTALNTANLAFNNSNVAGNFANAAATAAYNTANAAFAKANAAATGMSVAANTPTGIVLTPSTLVLSNTANIYVANTGTTNLFHELTTTGVSAGAYGNSLFGATFTVDSRGRIVSASPVLMGDAIDAYNTANSAFGNSNTGANFANTAATAAYASANAIGTAANSTLVIANNAYNAANAAFAKANAGGGTVNSGASIMFSGGSNSTYYFTGYSPKSLTVFGARAFVQMAGEIGRCANINIAINGTVVTGLTQMFANTLNTKALILSTGSNSVVSGDIITAVVANNTVDSGNNIVVAIQLQ